MKLVLFDIDGILIPAGSIEFDYWKAAVKKCFGLDVSRDDTYMQGKTDREILIELLEQKGIKEPERDKRFLPALRDLGDAVSEVIKDIKIEKIPNVEKLIKTLLKKKHAVGLLTGNTYEKARVKLENADLWKYFKIGAFGDETKERCELVGIAMKDAKQKTGIGFRKEDVCLIGDTVRDIRCARDSGVKIIAVAVGAESMEQLKKEKPDYIFKDFGGIERIAAIIK